NQILATQGIRAFISALVESVEYNQVFGEDTVPYRRFPTLPAANFPNTEKLYNQLTKQNDEVVVPSFKPVQPRVGLSKDTPLSTQAIADIAQANGINQSQRSFAELGRSYNDG
ncbi:MAG: phycobilisome rod-core linker polypeptide, partial [Nostoc sp.]